MSASKLIFIKIFCSNVERSTDFYQMLGFETVGDVKVSNVEWVSKLYGAPVPLVRNQVMKLAAIEAPLQIELLEWSGLSRHDGVTANVPGTFSFSLYVKNLDDCYTELLSKGVRFITSPHKIESEKSVTTLVNLLDPDGAMIQLAETTRR